MHIIIFFIIYTVSNIIVINRNKDSDSDSICSEIAIGIRYYGINRFHMGHQQKWLNLMKLNNDIFYSLLDIL